jgi:hypothetical protein
MCTDVGGERAASFSEPTVGGWDEWISAGEKVSGERRLSMAAPGVLWLIG